MILAAIRTFLCSIGLHIYGPWRQTRWNPALDLFTDHRYCACGRTKARLVDGRTVPGDETEVHQ